jgi:hypothetical protein
VLLEETNLKELSCVQWHAITTTGIGDKKAVSPKETIPWIRGRNEGAYHGGRNSASDSRDECSRAKDTF